MSVPVLVAPMFDPGQGRIETEIPEGLTVGEIVTLLLPELPREQWRHLRIVLISQTGSMVLRQDMLHRIRPRSGVRLVMRLVPGKEVLRSVLTIVVAIAAAAIGFWAAGVFGALIGGLVSAGITFLGNLLINALIPPVDANKGNNDRDRDRPTYYISGWKNRALPGGVIPEVYGKIRFAPPFAVPPYSEIVGDVQYVRCVFLVGYGGPHGVAMSEFRLGDTSLSDYDEFTTEVREGLPTDTPLTLVRNQVAEQQIGAELIRPVPRDDLGQVVDGASISTPVIRTTGADASGASVIFGFPAGMGEVNNEGKTIPLSVVFNIYQAPAGTGAWVLVTSITVTSAKMEAFYRQFSWSFAARGRYDINVERMTAEHTKSSQQSRSTWVALQTVRPEYPIACPFPVALVAMRIKATYQINGSLDNFNLLASRRALDWDAATDSWVVRETQSPASAYRHCLQSDSNPKPVGNASLALSELADWHEYCALKGLKYNAVHDDEKTLRERLSEVTSAGRASQRHDGLRWGVVVDRPQELLVDDINPRNSDQFKISRTYIDRPDGLRVRFADETNDFKSAERIVPWPGHVGDVALTEELSLPGKTNPAEIWIEARRRMYEAIHRPDSYSVRQDGPIRVATRGDLVSVSHYVIDRDHQVCLVKRVEGRLVELDGVVDMVEGVEYGLCFRVFASAEDTVGQSYIYPVDTMPGETDLIRFADAAGELRPAVDRLVTFGPISTVSNSLRVTRIESGEDFTVHMRLVDAAPIIDELTDAEEPPTWSGRAGDDVSYASENPPQPRITLVESGFKGTGVAGLISVSVAPGTGAVTTSSFRIQHRAFGTTPWSSIDFPAADGGVQISGYDTGEVVEIRLYALAADGALSAPSSIVTLTVGENDADLPLQIDDETVSVSPILGGSTLMFQTTDDLATVAVSIYRNTGPTIDVSAIDPVQISTVLPSRSYTTQDGDATRTNLLVNGSFDSETIWDLGTGWSIAAGAAIHDDGAAGSISQAVDLIAGRFYRVFYTVSGRTAGDVRPRLTGGTTSAGVTVSTNGNRSDRIQSLSGNNRLDFLASDDFDGSIDGVVLFLETASSLPAGTFNYWLEPVNADGLGGPVAGPFPVTIR
ncbi:MAG: hypothetical protein ACK43M_14360 [Allorhizobium sp.]